MSLLMFPKCSLLTVNSVSRKSIYIIELNTFFLIDVML